MDLRLRDHVSRCYSYEDGRVIYDLIKPQLLAGHHVNLSFDGFTTATSSFVNAALIDLLDSLDFERIKTLLHFTNTSKQIRDMIIGRFRFEVAKRASP